jgi:hypothetical protein
MDTEQIPRRFDFARDSFAFVNELVWEYRTDAASGKMAFCRREPKSDYAHRCFVLVRAARQFLYHAQFDPLQKIADENTYRRLVRAVVSRSPWKPSAARSRMVIPGYRGLREFSGAWERLLKSECGGAWRSYVLRSHWRMIFPISRAHQERAAERLLAAIPKNISPIVHLVKFPSLTINHGMILFDVQATRSGTEFLAYDPNVPAQPARLVFDRATKTFSLPPNHYWAGGGLNVIEIYRSWLM